MVDIQAFNLINFIVIDFRKNNLLLYSHGIVSTTVETL